MKKSVLFAALGGMAVFAGTAGAQEVGRVLSATPVVQQVAVPRQVCSNQPMMVQQPNSGAGAVVGGIAGGAVGNTIGHGSGRAAATAIGIIGGALLGNNIEGSGRQVQNVQQCSTQTSYENRTMGYNVVYEYAGREYNTQMPYDPGPTIRLQVTPLAANEEAPDTAGYGSYGQQNMAPPPMQQVQSVQPAVVAGAVAPGYPVYGAPAYPMYAPAPYYPAYGPAPIGLSLGIGFSSGGHRHHGR
jgi:uncharacterized protein YcfJ